MIYPIDLILHHLKLAQAAHVMETRQQHADRVARELGIDVELVNQAIEQAGKKIT